LTFSKNEFVVNIIIYLLLFLFTNILFFNYINSADYSRILILISLVGIYFSITVFNFEYGILAFIFFIPLYHVIGRFFDISRFLTIYSMFLGCMLGSIVYLMSKKDFLVKIDLKIVKPIIIFIVFITISFLFVYLRIYDYLTFYNHPYRDFVLNVNLINSDQAFNLAIYQYMNYFCGFLFLFLITKIECEKKFMDKLFFTLFASNTIVFLSLIHQIIINPYFMGQATWIGNESWIAKNTFTNRYGSTLVDPNSLGIYSIILIIGFIGFTYYYKVRFKKLFGIFAIVESFVLLIFSGSRTAMMGLIIVILFFLFVLIFRNVRKKIRRKRISAKKIFIISTSIFLIIVLFTFLFSIFILKELSDDLLPVALKRVKYDILFFSSGNIKEGIYNFLGGRKSLWKGSIYIIKDFPISGTGIGMTTVELPNYSKIYKISDMVRDMADNYYLQVLVELGIFALLVNLWIYFEVIRSYKKVMRSLENIRLKYFITNIFLVLPIMLVMFISGAHTYFMGISFLFNMFLGIIINFYSNIGKDRLRTLINEDYN